MKEFIDKLISRLEEAKVSANRRNAFDSEVSYSCAIEIVNRLAEEYKGGWIPCENELPKEYTDVLGCDYNGNIYVLELYKDSIFGNIWRQWNGGLLRLDVIVAWMPLPAPFKEGE